MYIVQCILYNAYRNLFPHVYLKVSIFYIFKYIYL